MDELQKYAQKEEFEIRTETKEVSKENLISEPEVKFKETQIDKLSQIPSVSLEENQEIPAQEEHTGIAIVNIEFIFQNAEYADIFQNALNKNNSDGFLDMMGGYNQLKAKFQNSQDWISQPKNMLMLRTFQRAVNDYYEKNRGWKFTSSGRKRRNMARDIKTALEGYIASLSQNTRELYQNIDQENIHEAVIKYDSKSIENMTKTSEDGTIPQMRQFFYQNESMSGRYNEYQKLYKDIQYLTKNKALKTLLAAGDNYQEYSYLLNLNNSFDEKDKTCCMNLREWMTNPSKYGIVEEGDSDDITLSDVKLQYEKYNYLRLARHTYLFTIGILGENMERIRNSANISQREKTYIQSIYERAHSLVINDGSFEGALLNGRNNAYSDYAPTETISDKKVSGPITEKYSELYDTDKGFVNEIPIELCEQYPGYLTRRAGYLGGKLSVIEEAKKNLILSFEEDNMFVDGFGCMANVAEALENAEKKNGIEVNETNIELITKIRYEAIHQLVRCIAGLRKIRSEKPMVIPEGFNEKQIEMAKKDEEDQKRIRDEKHTYGLDQVGHFINPYLTEEILKIHKLTSQYKETYNENKDKVDFLFGKLKESMDIANDIKEKIETYNIWSEKCAGDTGKYNKNLKMEIENNFTALHESNTKNGEEIYVISRAFEYILEGKKLDNEEKQRVDDLLAQMKPSLKKEMKPNMK